MLPKKLKELIQAKEVSGEVAAASGR